MRIIFMGTPEFAVQSLKSLVEAGKNVVAVITAPDKPAGRGQKLAETPVKKYALSQGIDVIQPEKLKNPDFLQLLASYKADIQVVVAFRMLPEVVWSMPPKGTFNLHASLLPQYRGAAPINWAIINGEKMTGLTTFFIEKEIDTGKIIFARQIPIETSDNAGSLHDKLMLAGGDLVLETVNAIEAGDYPQIPQKESDVLNPAPKIFKEDCEIDWSKTSEQLYNFTRGMSPYPAAWTYFGDKVLKIFEVQDSDVPLSELTEVLPGFYTDQKKILLHATADGLISITDLQLEGKKRMKTDEFLRGQRF